MTINLTVPFTPGSAVVYAPVVAAGPPQATRDAVRRRILDLSDTNPQLADATGLDEAIRQAVTRYASDRPRELTADIVGTGSEYYALTGGGALLASWSEGLSQIITIDYPAAPVAAGYQPNWLDSSFDWTYYRDQHGIVYLRFRTVAPTAAQTARVSYTATHVHSATIDTIPPGDLDAVRDLAASYACQALATKAAATQDSLIAADSTNYRDGQIRFSQQAKAWEDSYKRRMGISDNEAGASAVADWNRTATTGGPFLTHRRRWG